MVDRTDEFYQLCGLIYKPITRKPKLEKKKKDSILIKRKKIPPVLWLEDDEEIPATEQLLLENKALENEFENELEIAHTTLLEIQKMQNIINQNLAMQSETISAIDKNVEESVQNVTAGQVYLRKARQVFGGNRWWVLYFFVTLSATLLFLDYLYV